MSQENKAYIVQLVKQIVHTYFAEEIADILIAHGMTFKTEPQTNADRIRSMTDEELSEFLTHMNPTNCQDCGFSHGWRCQSDRDDYSDFEKCKEGRKRWLQQPAEDIGDGT